MPLTKIQQLHIRLLQMPFQLLWNSSTANSPDNVRVYRATIAPLDQPAAARTDVSDTPLRNACTAQPRLQACAEGAPKRRSSWRTAFDVRLKSEPEVRPFRCRRKARRVLGEIGTILGLPVFDWRTTMNPP